MEISALALFNVLFHFIFAGNLEYHRDELLYFALGLHPDFGYATVPPLIGWISWLMQNLFGFSVYAVRIFPSILSGIMIFLSASVSRELGASRYGAFLAALGLTVSIFFMRSFSLFQPVYIEIFLWTLCIYLIIKYINTRSGHYLIWFGIAAGFSLLNKYLAGILFAGLLVTVPFSPHRAVFKNRYFLLGIGTAALIFLPNLVWQLTRGLPAINHIGELYDTQLVYMDIPLFLQEQLMMPFIGTLFTMAGLVFLLTSKKAAEFRFLGYLAVLIITALMVLKGKSYYTLGIFPILISAGAVAYERLLKWKVARIIFPVMIVLLTIPVTPMGIPVLEKEKLKSYFADLERKYGIDLGRRFEDGTIHTLPQDYADMIGWEELTALADSAYRKIEDKEASFIYAENYGQASAVTIIGRKYGLPQAVCFSESYRYWIPDRFEPDIRFFVYINDEPGDDVKSLFRKIERIGSISDPDAREYGTAVFLCSEPESSFNEFWKLRLDELNRTGD